jgi:hypothetical protein
MKFSVVEIESFRKYCRSTLRGFCTVAVPTYGLRIFEVTVYRQNNSCWAMPPAMAQLDRTARNLSRSADGRPIFMPALMFFDADTRRSFSANVVFALLAQYPTAFDCGEEEEAA